MKNKGFTLIELLAVIIILGVIMLIAIPSVTRYINESRKNTYIDTARQIVKGAIPLVNSGELDVYDTNTTYYIPASCVPTENSMSSPFGEFDSAYVVIIYTGEGFKYYWTSTDTAKQGILLTEYNSLSTKDIKPNTDTILPTKGIGQRGIIRVLNSNCDAFDEGFEPEDKMDENGGILCDSFSSQSWSTIISNVKNNKIDCYHVGDTKDVEIAGFGTHLVRIANISKPDSCNDSGFSKSACGFVLEFTDIISPQIMGSGFENTGGWRDSVVRSYLSNTILPALPEVIRNNIIDTSIVVSYGGNNPYNLVTTDKLYLLSVKEVYNYDYTGHDATADYTRQLDYYASTGTTKDNYSAAKKIINTNESYPRNVWWLRTVVSSSNFNNASYNGNPGENSAYYRNGVSPAFRIG